MQGKEVLSLLRSVAKRGHAVILKAEHIRASLLAFVDDITIIGDRTAHFRDNILYSGPFSEMEFYFNSIGLSCPAHRNPTDFYFHAGAVDRKNEESFRLSSLHVERLADVFRRRRDQEKQLTLQWKKLLSTRHQSSTYNKVLELVIPFRNGNRRRKFLKLGVLTHVEGSLKNLKTAASHCWKVANRALCTVKRLHLIAWRRTSQDKGVNLARFLSSLLSSLLIGAACLVMGKVS